MQGSSSADVVDMGIFTKRPESPTDFCVALKSLSSFQKYNLLINHKKPHKHQQFPTTYIGGCNRSFRQVWLDEHPWMVYSESVDGVFCIYYALFSSDSPRGRFVSQPFRLWNKKGQKAKEYEKRTYHKHALDKAHSFKHSLYSPDEMKCTEVCGRLIGHQFASPDGRDRIISYTPGNVHQLLCPLVRSMVQRYSVGFHHGQY